MFPLHFHYEDVSRQDPLLKPNHANVMEVPRSCEIRVVPKPFAPSSFGSQNGKLAMEISCGQRFVQTQRSSTGKSFRSNPFLGSDKERVTVNDLARQSTLRWHFQSNFFDQNLNSNVSVIFSDHFEIFEHIRGFHVTIVTLANTQDETLPLWSGFFQKEEGDVR
ncbi:unnamed protein product [Victoria cruziana]